MYIRGISFIFVNSKRMALMEYAKYCNICGKKLHCHALSWCPEDTRCEECDFIVGRYDENVTNEYCTCTDKNKNIFYKYSVLYAEHMDLQDQYRETQIELLQKREELLLQQEEVEFITKRYKELYSMYVDLKMNNNINK